MRHELRNTNCLTIITKENDDDETHLAHARVTYQYLLHGFSQLRSDYVNRNRFNKFAESSLRTTILSHGAALMLHIKLLQSRRDATHG